MIYPREGTITNNGGKGGDNRGNRRRSSRRRGNNNKENRDEHQQQGRNNRSERNRASFVERPKWTPPPIPSEPLPTLVCHYCGKPIHDIASAIADKGSSNSVHFDCVISRIIQEEKPEKGDVVAYIGGGRFGIVSFNDPSNSRNFTVKKILEWENKDERAEWRSRISDHFSVT